MNTLQQEEYKILLELKQILEEHDIKYVLYAGTFLGAIRHKGFIPWDDDVDIVLTRREFDKIDKVLSNPQNLKPGYSYQTFTFDKENCLPFAKLRSDGLDITEIVSKTQKGYDGPWVDLFIYDNIPDQEEDRIEQYNKVLFYNKLIKFFLMINVVDKDKGIKRLMKSIVQFMNETFYKLNFIIPILYKKRHKWMTMYNDIETEYCADLCYMYFKSFDEHKATRVRHSELADIDHIQFESETFPSIRDYDTILTRYYGDYMTLPDEEDRKIHNIVYK